MEAGNKMVKKELIWYYKFNSDPIYEIKEYEVKDMSAKGIIESIGNTAVNLRRAIKNDIPTELQGQIEVELIKLEQQIQQSQIELNKIEAARGFFHFGWRPSVGWTCTIALALHFFFFPIIRMFIPDITSPDFDMGTLIPLILALLGLGGMRSWEKKSGVQDKH